MGFPKPFDGLPVGGTWPSLSRGSRHYKRKNGMKSFMRFLKRSVNLGHEPIVLSPVGRFALHGAALVRRPRNCAWHLPFMAAALRDIVAGLIRQHVPTQVIDA
jgi:hypothetical protein